ncbi:MAG: hypothetical protein GF344_03110 [Chitinivibrionales bacterium]|nr:hypothetical protein [Chitinivibrionales bacterium]MBD3356068.1 hypothetical protein [Chitinivibrionales bacterium]
MKAGRKGLDRRILQWIVESSPDIEAAVCVGKDGLPLTCYSRHPKALAATIGTSAAGLFEAANGLGLLSTTHQAAVAVDVEHGTMYIKEVSCSTLVIVLTVGDVGHHTIEDTLSIALHSADTEEAAEVVVEPEEQS